MKKIINFYNEVKYKNKKKFLPLHEPHISNIDKRKILQCLNSGYVSTSGKDIQIFEKKIKNFIKNKYVVSTISGTAALQIALKVLGVKANDEVLLPSVAFVAAANAILYNFAQPHFVDSDKEHFGVCPKKLENYLKKNTYIKKNKCINKKTKKIIKAMIIVHIFGHPAQIKLLVKIAKKFKIKVLEDAAEGLGSTFQNKHIGTFGDIGVLSFNGNKIITTGMGGAILTNNKIFAKKCKHYVSVSKIDHKWEFKYNEIGYNYRLPNLNAILGISQMGKIKKYLNHKRKLYKKIKNLIMDNNNLDVLNEPKKCKSNFWIQTLILKKPSLTNRNKIINRFHQNKILARPLWKPLHKLKFLKKFPKMNLDNTKAIEKKIINIPSSYYI